MKVFPKKVGHTVGDSANPYFHIVYSENLSPMRSLISFWREGILAN
jgi:hypothetical protein